MLISEKFKICYIHIPKTAGASFKKFINQYDNKSYEYKNYHSPITINDYNKFKNYYKIVIVRNSFNVCSSCWFFETKNPRKKFDDRRGMNFETWIDWKNKNNNPDHAIFPKQLPFFKHDNKFLVDKIINFDNIESEINDLCIKYKWKNNFKNIKIHKIGNYDWRTPYNENGKNIELVKEICKDDIEYFNFKYE